MTGNLKYQAYQTAYIAAGFIVQLWLVTIVLLLFAWLVVLPFIVPIDFIKDYIIEKLIGVAPSLGYLLFIIGMAHIIWLILNGSYNMTFIL